MRGRRKIMRLDEMDQKWKMGNRKIDHTYIKAEMGQIVHFCIEK